MLFSVKLEADQNNGLIKRLLAENIEQGCSRLKS